MRRFRVAIPTCSREEVIMARQLLRSLVPLPFTMGLANVRVARSYVCINPWSAAYSKEIHYNVDYDCASTASFTVSEFTNIFMEAN